MMSYPSEDYPLDPDASILPPSVEQMHGPPKGHIGFQRQIRVADPVIFPRQ